MKRQIKNSEKGFVKHFAELWGVPPTLVELVLQMAFREWPEAATFKDSPPQLAAFMEKIWVERPELHDKIIRDVSDSYKSVRRSLSAHLKKGSHTHTAERQQLLEALAKIFNVSKETMSLVLMFTFSTWRQAHLVRHNPEELAYFASSVLAQQGSAPQREFLRDIRNALSQLQAIAEQAKRGELDAFHRDEQVPGEAYRIERDRRGSPKTIWIAVAADQGRWNRGELDERFKDLQAFLVVHPEIILTNLEREHPDLAGKLSLDMMVAVPALK